MTARLRPAKNGTLEKLVRRLEEDLRAAANAVTRAKDDELHEMRAQIAASEALLRQQNQPFVSAKTGRPWPVEVVHDDPAGPCRRYAAEAIFLAAMLRSGSEYFRKNKPNPDLKLAARPPSKPGSERVRLQVSCGRLIRWLVEQDVTKGMTLSALRTGDWDAKTVYEVSCLHRDHALLARPCEHGSDCQTLAICRALDILSQGFRSPVTTALRGLADTSFDVAETLGAALSKLDPTSIDNVGSLAVLKCTASLIHALYKSIQTNALIAPYDQAPRGTRPRQWLLLDAGRRLEQGGFSDAQIADFLDDGFGGDRRKRERRVRDRLDEAGEGGLRWLRYGDDPAPVQTAAGESEDPHDVWPGDSPDLGPPFPETPFRGAPGCGNQNAAP